MITPSGTEVVSVVTGVKGPHEATNRRSSNGRWPDWVRDDHKPITVLPSRNAH